MADADITIVGSSSYGPASATERPITTTSASGTLAGHYILVFATMTYQVASTDTDLSTVAGVTWSSPVEINDSTVARSRMWLGQVTTNGQKTITVNGTSNTRMYVHAYTLDPGAGGTITVDATSTTISTDAGAVANTGLNYTFTHKTLTATGTKDLLVAFLSTFQSGQTGAVNMGAAVSPMTVGQSVAISTSTRTQSVYQTLSASGDVGTRQQQWTLNATAALAGAAGIMTALRAQVEDVTPAAPTVNAGADASTSNNAAFLRTATENANNATITSRAWTIVSGPAGTGTTIGTSAALNWTPSTIGSYVLRYSATNSEGTGTDDVSVNVTTATGTATVTHQWIGIGSVVFKTVGSSTVRVGFSVSSNMAGAVFSSAQTPSNQITKHTFPSLTPGATYYYQAEQDGGFIGTAQAFIAPPAANVATSYSFAVASCLGSDESPVRDFPLASDVASRGARFFLQIGDIHYANVGTQTLAAHRAPWDNVVFSTSARPNMVSMLKSIPTHHIFDDHDFCGDNSDGSNPARSYAQAVYRERVPHFDLPSTEGIYQTFVAGRVRFIFLDCRSYRTSPTTTDSSSKTMLGSAQKTWLTDLLPTITQPLTFIISTVTWNEEVTAAGATNTDAWGKYATERAQLVTLLQSATNTRIAFLCGDWHGLAIDNGSNAPGRFPTYLAAAMRQYANADRGGPWSEGSLKQTGTSDAHYGLVTVTDDGVNISWTFNGVKSDATLWNASHSARTIEPGRLMLGGL